MRRMISDTLQKYIKDMKTNHPDPSAEWGGEGSTYTAGDGIDITNNEISIDNTVALKSDIITDYDDLTNKPTIPTKTSDLTNDSGFITSSDLPTNYVTTDTAQTITATKSITNNTNILSNKKLALYNSAAIADYTKKVEVNSEAIMFTSTGNDKFRVKISSAPGGVSISQNLYFPVPDGTSSKTLATTDQIPTTVSQLTNDAGYSSVSGTNDGTNWTSLTVGSDTYNIPSGGASGSTINLTVASSFTEFDNSVYIPAADLPNLNKDTLIIVHNTDRNQDYYFRCNSDNANYYMFTNDNQQITTDANSTKVANMQLRIHKQSGSLLWTNGTLAGINIVANESGATATATLNTLKVGNTTYNIQGFNEKDDAIGKVVGEVNSEDVPYGSATPLYLGKIPFGISKTNAENYLCVSRNATSNGALNFYKLNATGATKDCILPDNTTVQGYQYYVQNFSSLYIYIYTDADSTSSTATYEEGNTYVWINLNGSQAESSGYVYRVRFITLDSYRKIYGIPARVYHHVVKFTGVDSNSNNITGNIHIDTPRNTNLSVESNLKTELFNYLSDNSNVIVQGYLDNGQPILLASTVNAAHSPYGLLISYYDSTTSSVITGLITSFTNLSDTVI